MEQNVTSTYQARILMSRCRGDITREDGFNGFFHRQLNTEIRREKKNREQKKTKGDRENKNRVPWVCGPSVHIGVPLFCSELDEILDSAAKEEMGTAGDPLLNQTGEDPVDHLACAHLACIDEHQREERKFQLVLLPLSSSCTRVSGRHHRVHIYNKWRHGSRFTLHSSILDAIVVFREVLLVAWNFINHANRAYLGSDPQHIAYL